MQAITLHIAKAIMPEVSLAEKQEAFAQLVQRFQDMAYGYAYSILGDPNLAEEVAQEAFLTAWQRLHQLQQPEAFPAWFKRIVLTHCHRLTRRKQVQTVALEAARHLAVPGPHLALEHAERKEAVHRAIQALPEGERIVVILFYINDYSREDIARFLDISVVAVKKRLASARKRLQKGMLSMVQDDLHAQRPSRNTAFTKRVLAFSQQLGDLLISGTPILAALELCATAQQDNPRFQQAIREMKQKVSIGDPIMDVMLRYPDLFSERYVQVFAFGEESGTLDVVLRRLAQGETFETEEAFRALQEEARAIIAGREWVDGKWVARGPAQDSA